MIVACLICTLWNDFEFVTWDCFGCHLKLFKVASTQIFFRVATWKFLGFILAWNKKKSGDHTEKNMGRCYPKQISKFTLNKSQNSQSTNQ